jgi:hypothetical protein
MTNMADSSHLIQCPEMVYEYKPSDSMQFRPGSIFLQ